jgi:hypothetical protein
MYCPNKVDVLYNISLGWILYKPVQFGQHHFHADWVTLRCCRRQCTVLPFWTFCKVFHFICSVYKTAQCLHCTILYKCSPSCVETGNSNVRHIIIALFVVCRHSIFIIVHQDPANVFFNCCCLCVCVFVLF